VPIDELLIKNKESDISFDILIDKSDYKLTIYSNDSILKEYPVVFGSNYLEDKLRQGDKRTPEGVFKMEAKYPHDKWEKFIWINYPTADSWMKHNKAKKDGLIPADSKIGGEIGIHGVPNNMNYLIDLKYNWTLGCISMKNADINEIFPYITRKSKIEIQK
jgi:murein L,D-transpeptidase YafK